MRLIFVCNALLTSQGNTCRTFLRHRFTARVGPRLPTKSGFSATRTMASETTTAAATSTPSPVVNFEGKEYEPVKEGLAYILKPVTNTPPPQKPRGSGFEQQTSVFYNPIQQFNRDLSVIAIKAYGNHAVALKTAKLARSQHQRKDKKSKKRKREEESDAGRSKPITEEGENTEFSVGNQEGRNEQQTVDAPEPSIAKAEQEQQPPSPPVRFQILDALSATGLRALRYAKEIPIATRIIANDLSQAAIETIKVNIKYNDVENIVRPNVGDARVYMYSLQTEKKPDVPGKFDVIDLDPYGTAAPFLDAAVQAVNDGGMLCVTCTDAGVFASTGYPEKAFSLYGGVSVRLPHGHEVGLRLIIHAVATAAAKYGLSVEPLLSLSIDYYARVFVRVHKSPAEVKFLSGTTMLLYSCDSGCGAWSTQYLTSTKSRTGKAGEPFLHHSLAQAPTASEFCEHCGFKTHLAGPMWGGPLHNAHFIQKLLAMLPELDPETYKTLDRIEGMLTTALEEDLDYVYPKSAESEEPSSCTTKPQQQQQKQQQEEAQIVENSSPLIPRLDPILKEKYPFFVSLSALSKVLHAQTIPMNMFCSAIHSVGYRTTRSHTKPNSVRTDAPWDVIWEVMREWVRQKAPLKEGTLAATSPGAMIMKKNRIHYESQQALVALQKEIADALESGSDVRDLTTKIEAALYRRGAHASTIAAAVAAHKQAPKHQDDNKQHFNNEKTTNGNSTLSATTTTEKPHPSTLEIVFDETLAEKSASSKKRVVRYQMNPEANWGPMSRASGR